VPRVPGPENGITGDWLFVVQATFREEDLSGVERTVS